MRKIRFKSCKITTRIPLDRLASFFRLQKLSSWKEYIVLNGHYLEDILKINCNSKSVYLFEFGCVTFVEFEEDEVQVFLDFLAGIVEKIDYAMFARFSENHSILVGDDSTFKPWSECTRFHRFDEPAQLIISVILAKSAALDKIETDVNENMDETERYVEYLRKGKFHMNKKAFSLIIYRILKFEFESINNIRIFDRSAVFEHRIKSRDLYDSLAGYYELDDRFAVLQSKTASLHRTAKAYNVLSYKGIENRLYVLEIFLLALFPLVSLIHRFLGL